ncbi:hypothetical protein BV898_18164 [Hypsibius exemplaris]|uniref:Uncharacterized protein n=1 Tax=Hypsibius exemplaris TaxID=2072580 RepID=A0A9X6NGQ9_HYPEX|nr:hypothetical protein BV898_18164 [Hypsibius exemplaris]
MILRGIRHDNVMAAEIINPRPGGDHSSRVIIHQCFTTGSKTSGTTFSMGRLTHEGGVAATFTNPMDLQALEGADPTRSTAGTYTVTFPSLVATRALFRTMVGDFSNSSLELVIGDGPKILPPTRPNTSTSMDMTGGPLRTPARKGRKDPTSPKKRPQ